MTIHQLFKAAGLLRRSPLLSPSSSLSRNRTSGVRAALLSLSIALAFGGCAALQDCGDDWYAIGQRDGRLGARPQADLYAKQCAAVDADRYDAGWSAGYSQRPNIIAF